MYNPDRYLKKNQAFSIIFIYRMKKVEHGQLLKSLLGKNIKQFRSNLGLTVENLAERAEISIPYLGAIERGTKWPGAGTIQAIAQGLEVMPYDLLKAEDSLPRDIKKIAAELANEIETAVNKSIKKMNSVIREKKT